MVIIVVSFGVISYICYETFFFETFLNEASAMERMGRCRDQKGSSAVGRRRKFAKNPFLLQPSPEIAPATAR
nr:MAG: hypothetical protein DIU57_16150 [Pseudomonadota bacterium]